MINNLLTKAIIKSTNLRTKIMHVMSNKSGEGFVDTAVKILISVVVGALILAGIYALFGDTILPTLTDRIENLFDYAG